MSFLQKIEANNNYSDKDKIPLVVDHQRVGQVRREYVEYLLSSNIFQLEEGVLGLIPSLKKFDQRNKALRGFAKKVYFDGLSNRFMNENYPLISQGNAPVALIDRSISTLLGTLSFGQHLNAYVMTDEGMKMWIGRRAYNNPHHAGKLDHLVAGGLPYDITPRENLIKECYEEAGMERSLATQAKSVGLVSYHYEYELGGKPDIIYCYDLELDRGFVPHCTDGEVEAFYLMPLEEVADIVKNTDEFKTNCNLVIIDFLVRHGFITVEDRDYIEIVQGLRR